MPPAVSAGGTVMHAKFPKISDISSLLQSLEKRLSRLLISRFSEKSEHIFLIALNSRLVERINAE